MVKKLEEMPGFGKRHIDLTGPEGNAYCLLGIASKWAKQLNLDSDDIIKRMKSGDYENLLNVFENEFGEFATLYK